MKDILNKKHFTYILALLSGIIMWLGWPTFPLTFLLFIGFIPIFILEDILSKRSLKWPKITLFLHLYLAMIVWNAGTLYWICFADTGGMIAALVLNSFFMTLPFLLYRSVKRRVGNKIGYISFICFWITFEYIHLNWDLSWPWLTIGNAFAMFPSWIQWYEYSGVLGGTLWVLLINVIIHYSIKKNYFKTRKEIVVSLSLIFFFVLFPMAYSYLISNDSLEEDHKQGMEVVIIQPNEDPYDSKFSAKKWMENFQNLLAQTEKSITNQTQYVIWPETALQGDGSYYGVIDIDALEYFVWPKLLGHKNVPNMIYYGNYKQIFMIKEFLEKHPELTILTGIGARKVFRDSAEVPPMTRENQRIGKHMPLNASLALSLNGISTYYKSKLVLGVEKIPYPIIFEPLVNTLDIEGAANLATQKEAEVFVHQDSSKVAPLICYESIYGEYTNEFVAKGATWIAIMTNDGWWKNTDGHRHHFLYGALRAIETRKPIARSANTGISCFFNTKGEAIYPTKYWEKDAIIYKIHPNTIETFYVRNGDILGRLASFLSMVLLFSALVRKKTDV